MSVRLSKPGPFVGPYLARGAEFSFPVWDGKHGCYRWAVASIEDYRLVMSRRWRLGTDGYICSSVWDGRQSVSLSLHRLIARARQGEIVDHARHDVLDVRRQSLRRCNVSQNAANARRLHLVGKKSSRYRGVTRHTQTGKWQGQVKYMGRSYHCGLHETEEAAARARDAVARRLFGKFAILNNLPPTPQKRRRAA
jgi:hypothetical protein